MVEAIFREELPTLQPALAGFTRDPYLRLTNAKTATYVDIFVDGLLGLAQYPPTGGAEYSKTCFIPWTRFSGPVTRVT